MEASLRTGLIVLLWLACWTEPGEGLNRQKRIVGGRAAGKPAENQPVVYLTKKEASARIIGTRDPVNSFYLFRGIRFGQPPVGPRRFQRASPVRLEGEINATRWAPACPQPDGNSRLIVGSEDCLFLNVFTPKLPDSTNGYPVLIWIHGGGFRRGSACQYEVARLVRKKLVVVSIQYRLGSLGFLSTGTKELPGNNGIFDMHLAVHWIRENIEYFGGDPRKIVPFGHGTGASAAFMLSLSSLSKNFFSGLIAMSGSILSHFAFDKDPRETARYIAEKNDCPTENEVEMVRCLRELPVQRLIESDSLLETVRTNAKGFISGLSVALGPSPVVEGPNDQRGLPNFVTERPEESLKSGKFPQIPLLIGVMKNELAAAILGGYRLDVERRLRQTPDFLSNEFIPSLQNFIPNFGNRSQLIPEALTGYLNVFQGGTGTAVSKIAEAMGDSLYNVPAYLTLNHWTKRATAYLYSFDHVGERNYGKHFLAGLPTVNAGNASDITGHGDDLGYIFGQNRVTGEKLWDSDGPGSNEDEQVSSIITEMIAEFARDRRPSVFESGSSVTRPIGSFTAETSPFLSLTSAPRMMNNFRYCEIGLWTGLPDRVRSSTCELFAASRNAIQTGANAVLNPLGVAGSAADELTKKNANEKGILAPKVPGLPFLG